MVKVTAENSVPIEQSLASEDVIRVEGIVDLMSELPAIHELYHSKDEGGFTTGWQSLDGNYKVGKTGITIITGIPSHGKSTFLNNLIINMSRQHKWKWGIFSPEEAPVKKHVQKLIEIASGRTFKGVFGSEVLPENKIDAIVAKFNNFIKFIDPVSSDFTIESILSVVRACKEQFDISAYVLDPYNEFSHTRPLNMSETEYVSRFLQVIRRMNTELELHCFLVAHPTKLKKNDKGDYDVPTAYDISGSANFYNKADNIVSIWRDKLNGGNRVQVHIQKVRNREQGQIGQCFLDYNYKTGQLESGHKYDKNDVHKERKDLNG
jgi:twinkle protein